MVLFTSKTHLKIKLAIVVSLYPISSVIVGKKKASLVGRLEGVRGVRDIPGKRVAAFIRFYEDCECLCVFSVCLLTLLVGLLAKV